MAANPQSLSSPLPPMPGGPITGPDAWRADEMRERDDWVHVLSESEIAEIDAAIEAVDIDDRPIAGMGRGDFHLPRFGQVLDAIREELVRGRGFVLIRGLPVERYSTRRRFDYGGRYEVRINLKRRGDTVASARTVVELRGGRFGRFD